jgi:hypothetical protein
MNAFEKSDVSKDRENEPRRRGACTRERVQTIPASEKDERNGDE